MKHRWSALVLVAALWGTAGIAEAQSIGGTLVYQSVVGTGGIEIHLTVHGPAAAEVDARHHGLWECVGSPVYCRTFYMQADGEQFHPSASTGWYGFIPQVYVSPASGHPAALMHLDPSDPYEWVFILPNGPFGAVNIPTSEHDPASPGGQFRVWHYNPSVCEGEMRPEGPADYYAEFGISTRIPVGVSSHFDPLTGCRISRG